MKAVTSSIALVAMVALSGLLVVACSDDESLYMQLNNCLIQLTKETTLEANVNAAWKLICERSDEFDAYNDLFQNMVRAFEKLRDGIYWTGKKVCSATVLGNLRFLINEALNYDKNLPNPNINAFRLNSLLIELKRKVRSTCYLSIQSQWNILRRVEGDDDPASPYAIQEFTFLNLNLQHRELQPFIYRPEDAPESTILEDEFKFSEIIRDALLHGDNIRNGNNISTLQTLKDEEVREYGKSILHTPCSNLIKSVRGIAIFRRALHVLALDMMDFPQGESSFEDAPPPFNIISLPAYIICRKLLQ